MSFTCLASFFSSFRRSLYILSFTIISFYKQSTTRPNHPIRLLSTYFDNLQCFLLSRVRSGFYRTTMVQCIKVRQKQTKIEKNIPYQRGKMYHCRSVQKRDQVLSRAQLQRRQLEVLEHQEKTKELGSIDKKIKYKSIDNPDCIFNMLIYTACNPILGLIYLQDIHNSNYKSQKHKYVNEDILKMAEETFPKTKYTKYEIIYKETVKKLNKFCINQIYKKLNPKVVQNVTDSRKQSLNTLKILSHFQAKVQDYMRKANCQTKIKTQEEKQLDEIIRSLRYQSYQEPTKMQRSLRNPVSIISCLVGYSRAKRIVEQQLNHLQ